MIQPARHVRFRVWVCVNCGRYWHAPHHRRPQRAAAGDVLCAECAP